MIRGKRKNCGSGWRGCCKHNLRILAVAIAISVFLWPYTLSYCDLNGTFRLVNRTQHYLHVMIDAKPYTFVPPGGMIMEDFNPYGGVIVDVTYSPGQGVKGKASKTFQAVIHTTETALESHDCSSTGTGGNSCSRSRSSSSSSTITVDPLEWQVVPSDLTLAAN